MSRHKREGGGRAKRSGRCGVDKEALVYLTEMEITTEPMSEPGVGTAPPELKDEMEEFHEKLRTLPGKIIPRLEELTAKYPNIPSLGNWLMVAYLAVATEYLLQTADLEGAKEYVRMLEELAPDHPQTQHMTARLAMLLAGLGLERLMGPRGRRDKAKRRDGGK